MRLSLRLHGIIALLAVLATLGCTTTMAARPRPEYIIAGNDEKVRWDDAGKVVLGAPGKDTVSIIDISNREAPRVVVNLPLMNTIIGPPTNLAITPDGTLAIVANSMAWIQDGAAWKNAPDNKLYLIDLTASPPAHIGTIDGGKQPSGMAINRAGDLALVANRADNSISVLSIRGKDVKVVDTIAMGEQVAAVAFTPDGKRAFAVKFAGHKVAMLEIDGQKVTYTKYDMPVGLWPYNIDVTPDGKLALTADNGNSGASDGHVDTVSVIDLEANPPRVIDRVVVGDAPEGFAISPRGDIAIALLLNGSAAVPKTAWYANKTSRAIVLKIDGKKVTKVGDVEVGAFAEGLAFSPDGQYVYVGNYVDNNVSILRVDGTTVTNTGKTLKLPGAPASMRGRAR
jgi:DNA-binding beta-propeller fold protein YncE